MKQNRVSLIVDSILVFIVVVLLSISYTAGYIVSRTSLKSEKIKLEVQILELGLYNFYQKEKEIQRQKERDRAFTR